MKTLFAGVAAGLLVFSCESEQVAISPIPIEGFGRLCEADVDCSGSARCFTFASGSPSCTVPCRFDAECPTGSAGRRCDSQGYCLP